MKLIFMLFGAGILAVLATAHAQNGPNYNDTVNCKWRDGRDMDQRDCVFFRKQKSADEADEAAHRDRTQSRLQEQPARYLGPKRDQGSSPLPNLPIPTSDPKGNDLAGCVWANGAPMSEEHCGQARREEQSRLEYKRLQDDRKKAIEALRKEQVAAEARQKKKCGADFQRPAIGQSIERFRLCVAEVVLIGQINRADGVVSIYEGSGYTVHGMKGKVVAWSN